MSSFSIRSSSTPTPLLLRFLCSLLSADRPPQGHKVRLNEEILYIHHDVALDRGYRESLLEDYVYTDWWLRR